MAQLTCQGHGKTAYSRFYIKPLAFVFFAKMGGGGGGRGGGERERERLDSTGPERTQGSYLVDYHPLVGLVIKTSALKGQRWDWLVWCQHTVIG